MPHREGYPGRRDGFIGHRDGIPEDPLAFLRQSRRILIKSITNAKRWNIPAFAIDGYKISYMNARDTYVEFEKCPPPEPNPIDGFTVYWDKKKRFMELLCAFHNVEVDENICFDGEELSRRILALNCDEHLRQWKEFLMGIVRGNAARFNMPAEWVEAVRQRMDKTLTAKQDGDSMQQTFLLLYQQN